MTSTPLASSPALAPRLGPPLALAGALVALGDWLFYGRVAGLSLPVFLAALAGAVLLANRLGASGREFALGAGLLVAALLPLVEALTALSAVFGVAGVALFAVTVTGGLGRGLRATLGAAQGLLLAGPLQLVPDLVRRWRQIPSEARRGLDPSALVGWAVPFLLCAVFGALFASANPLIEGWLAALDPTALLARISAGRLLVWAVLLSVAWPFVAVRWREAPIGLGAGGAGRGGAERPGSGGAAWEQLLSREAILRSLVLFNLLFAVQSGLDLAYLWGGVALPDGLTYAAYAHRGAYPLIVTALLAAGFVLVALRPGGAGERSPAIRALVVLWIAQNVGLVVSSILRLDLYVAVYSLTVTRFAAFVWMGLVVAGLVLIASRIALRRSNAWLIGANAMALALTLYVCAFVNVAGLIAGYNVAHSREGGGGGEAFDAGYALDLGPEAIPAVDRFLAARAKGTADPWAPRRDALAAHHLAMMADWRAWTFRGWRLRRYLEAGPAAAWAAGPAIAAPQDGRWTGEGGGPLPGPTPSR